MPTRRKLLTAAAALAVGAPAHAGDYVERLAAAYGRRIDPQAAHRQALTEARRLQARADRLLRDKGQGRRPVDVRLRDLASQPRWRYPDSDSGRDRAVADMNARLAALRPRLSRAFGELPIPDAVIRRMSREDEASGRGGYRDPPAYYIDLKTIGQRPSWSLPTVAFHETVPGHGLQAALDPPALDAVRLPIFSEAWATYAEQLAADLGAYQDDPWGEVGYLHWRLFRMARVVADTGQGALGWSEAQAGGVMWALQGRDVAFVTIAEDVRRIRERPAIYAAQGLGALEIGRRRPRNIADWPEYHRRVLTTGDLGLGAQRSPSG